MRFVQLRRQAPEVRNVSECSICGVHGPPQMEDHLLVGSPGVPAENGGICSTCGRVIEQIVQKLGSDLSIQVEHAQNEAAEHDTPALARKRMRH